METNYFKALAAVDCAEHIEKKNGFSYLSWAWAVRQLLSQYPTATWEVIRFNGLPYLDTPAGVFVEVAVTVEGVTRSQIHPVLNHKNQPIDTPNAFEINTSIQRALVKAIALHGLGLYIYAGEDLPESDGEPRPERKPEPKQPAKQQAPRGHGFEAKFDGKVPCPKCGHNTFKGERLEYAGNGSKQVQHVDCPSVPKQRETVPSLDNEDIPF